MVHDAKLADAMRCVIVSSVCKHKTNFQVLIQCKRKTLRVDAKMLLIVKDFLMPDLCICQTQHVQNDCWDMCMGHTCL